MSTAGQEAAANIGRAIELVRSLHEAAAVAEMAAEAAARQAVVGARTAGVPPQVVADDWASMLEAARTRTLRLEVALHTLRRVRDAEGENDGG